MVNNHSNDDDDDNNNSNDKVFIGNSNDKVDNNTIINSLDHVETLLNLSINDDINFIKEKSKDENDYISGSDESFVNSMNNSKKIMMLVIIIVMKKIIIQLQIKRRICKTKPNNKRNFRKNNKGEKKILSDS
jgi:hypothetical protein